MGPGYPGRAYIYENQPSKTPILNYYLMRLVSESAVAGRTPQGDVQPPVFQDFSTWGFRSLSGSGILLAFWRKVPPIWSEMIPDRNVSQVCAGYGSPVVFIQLPNSTISIVTVFSPHPPNKTGIPGTDRSPPLKIRSSLESSELMSDTYPVRPRIIRWVAEKITTVEPAGNSLPLNKSKYMNRKWFAVYYAKLGKVC